MTMFIQNALCDISTANVEMTMNKYISSFFHNFFLLGFLTPMYLTGGAVIAAVV